MTKNNAMKNEIGNLVKDIAGKAALALVVGFIKILIGTNGTNQI